MIRRKQAAKTTFLIMLSLLIATVLWDIYANFYMRFNLPPITADMTIMLIAAIILVIIVWDCYAHKQLGPSATVTTILIDVLYANKLAQIGFYGWMVYITIGLLERIVMGIAKADAKSVDPTVTAAIVESLYQYEALQICLYGWAIYISIGLQKKIASVAALRN